MDYDKVKDNINPKSDKIPDFITEGGSFLISSGGVTLYSKLNLQSQF